MRSAELLRNLESPRRRQLREVRLKVGGQAEDGVHTGRLMGEPLPVGQQVLFRQEVRDLGDLALTAVDLEGKASTCRCDGIEELKRACPQSLRFALPFGTGLRLTAFPFALGLDPACLLLQQVRALSGDFAVQAGPRPSTRIRPRLCKARAETR